MGLKTGGIASPKRHPDMRPGLRAGGDDDAIAPREDPAEAAVLTLYFGGDGDPDRIDAIEILGANRAGNRIDAARGEGRIVDGERELRRPGPLAFPQTGGSEQKGYRPWNLAERLSRNAAVPSFMS